jgi:hypothetical protein
MHAADQAVRTPRLGQAARATAERFGLDGMAGRLADLYGTLAGARA